MKQHKVKPKIGPIIDGIMLVTISGVICRFDKNCNFIKSGCKNRSSAIPNLNEEPNCNPVEVVYAMMEEQEIEWAIYNNHYVNYSRGGGPYIRRLDKSLK